VPGRLIALEGIDGSGKTTQARLLAGAVGASTVTTAEPGSTAVGVKLRSLLLDPSLPSLDARTETLLLCADRAQHVAEVIGPALAAGRWVVTDRFSGSTLAYQGYGHGLDVGELRRLVDWASGGIAPDLNVLVDVPVEEGHRRRGDAAPDRMEGLDAAFHRRVRNGYVALAEADSDRWAVVDGTGDVADVAARILAAVAARLGPLPDGGR
jgi:dTMP kinase